MKILFLTLSHGASDINGRGIYSDLLRYFANQGHSLYIAYSLERRLKKNTCLSIDGNVQILGIHTLNIQKTNVIEKGIGTLLLENQYLKSINKYWKDVSFDLILYSTPPITFNRVIKTVKNRTGAHSYLLLKDIFPQNAVDLGMFSKRSLLYKMFRRKEEKLYNLSDFIGCMSPANVDYVINNNSSVTREKVEVCPNSIELSAEVSDENRKEILDKYGIPSDVPLLIYGGNLGAPQGIDFLIEVLKSNEGRKDCFFLVIGSGTQLPKLKRMSEVENIANLMVKESLPKADYDRLVKTADVGLIFLDKRFTIPNFPSRLLSYLENRIPVLLATDVNTDMGRIAESNKFGLWAESGDLSGFNKKLDQILSDADKRRIMGDNGYQFLLDNYLVEQSYQIIMNHFS